MEIPLLSKPLDEGTREGAVSGAAQRLRELKLILAALETALSEEHQDRLHALVRRAEGMPFDAGTAELVEGLVRDLGSAVS